MVVDRPWPHLVIENYYSDEVFDVLRSEAKRFVKGNVDVTTRKQAFAMPENQTLRDCIDSRPLTEDMLAQFPSHRPYSALNLFWEVNFLLGPFNYPIHDESSRKVLSCVVYVDPDENNGTYLYNEDKTFNRQVAWKPNTALIFPAIDGVTWHDYDCPKGKYRVTVNQFLERPRDE